MCFPSRQDELVRVRTEAVTLMSADLCAKGKTTLDQLEDTRTEMKRMQKNFAEQESSWKEEMEILKVDLEAKEKRFKHFEVCNFKIVRYSVRTFESGHSVTIQRLFQYVAM